MTGRNQACPCGSGKKFKSCHGRSGQSPTLDRTGEHLSRAQSLLGQKFFDAALDAVRAAPDSAERYRLEVDILMERNGEGDLEAARQAIARWRHLQPRTPAPWSREFELALSRNDQDAMDRAVSNLVRLAPGHPASHYYRGLRAQAGGNLSEALEHYAAAAAEQYRDFAPATVRVMAASKAVDTAMGKHPGSLRRAWALLLDAPDVVQALKCSLDDWDVEEPTATRDERFWVANAWYQLAAAERQGMMDAERCQHYCIRALHLNPDHQAARTTHLFTLNYDTEKSPQEIHALHVTAGDWWSERFPQRKDPFANTRQPGKVLRVGYLSTDFREHPVAHFILPVLQHHDTRQVRSYVYHVHAVRDEHTERAARFAYRFLHAYDFDDTALARQIEWDAIDILVDLNGTSGQGRWQLLARRAAPIQITWIGSPNTSGLPTMDYRIVDANSDPPASAQAWSREKLLYLPRVFSVYDPLSTLPEVTRSPCLVNGHITFGSFNNVAKMNPPLIRCWAAILQRVPASRLLLKYPTLEFARLRQQLLRALGGAGVDPERVDFIGRIPGRHEHLEACARADIQLDTFPYHGTTTTCESLLMGIPVVTRAGLDHRSRAGVSLLSAVGRSEWIGRDHDAYVEIACRLARDPEGLADVRARLRDEVRHSPLMDAARFTRDLEQAYRKCWTHWCRQPAADRSAPKAG